MRSPIQVPRLGDASRNRIRQAVFDRLDEEAPGEATVPVSVASARPRRRGVVVAVGATSMLVAAAAAVVVHVARREAPRASDSVSRFATDDSPSRVTVGDADLVVGAHSALTVVTSGTGGVVVSLEGGEVRCAVAPRGDRPPFVVVAADVRVEVVGTRFTVARDGDRVDVHVEHGVVRVTRADATTLVRAGGRWPGAIAEAGGAAREELGEAGEAGEAMEAGEPEVIQTMDPLVLDHPPAPTGGHRPRPAPATATPDVSPIAPAPVAPDPRVRYEKAARLEATRPAEAIAIYRALAAEGGPWAPNALFAQARLELDLEHRPAARRLLETYLARYPRGANAAVARTLLDELR